MTVTSPLRAFLNQPRRYWQSWVAYVLVPLGIGFWVIAGAFNREGMIPVDSGDEAAETFIQVPMALSRLAKGEILKINLFNNFGTPILGEPVVYPYALHAWTYALFRPAIAMVVNKFFLTALTLVVLTVFFQRYFPVLIASLCSFLAFSGPQFFYFFQNHPHQGALLYFGAVLIAVRHFVDRPGGKRAFSVYATGVIFLFSVGINGSLLGLSFIAVYAALLARSRWRLFGSCMALGCAALVAVYAHFHEFFRLAVASARKDLDYQALALAAPFDVLKHLLVQDKIISVSVSYSWPIVLLTLAGLVLLRSRSKFKVQCSESTPANVELWRLSVLLGAIPCLGVLLLRLFPEAAASLPLVRATNVLRVLWFSDIFLMLLAGLAVLRLSQKLADVALGWRMLGFAVLTLSLVPRLAAFEAVRRCFVTSEETVNFQPQKFLAQMKPYRRLAGFTDPVPYSFDTKANAFQVLGSAGRSIILNKAFRDYLQRAGAIDLGYHGMTYYFRPAAPEKLIPFGIQQCIVPCEHLEDEIIQRLSRSGWTRLDQNECEDGRHRFYLVLFSSPYDVTPVYVLKGTELSFLQRYRIEGNEVSVELPADQSSSTVVATFVAQPGWKAFINGVAMPIERGEDQFIRVPVPPAPAATRQDATAPRRILRLKYEPYTDAFLVGSLMVSVLLGGGISWLAGGRSGTRGPG